MIFFFNLHLKAAGYKLSHPYNTAYRAALEAFLLWRKCELLDIQPFLALAISANYPLKSESNRRYSTLLSLTGTPVPCGSLPCPFQPRSVLSTKDSIRAASAHMFTPPLVPPWTSPPGKSEKRMWALRPWGVLPTSRSVRGHGLVTAGRARLPRQSPRSCTC